MGLMDEVAAVESAERAAARDAAKERKARRLEEAVERFTKAFGAKPDAITMQTEELEKRDGPATIYGRLHYEGASFALCYGRSGTLDIHALLECPTCKREFVSHHTFYGLRDEHRPEDRARNVRELALALKEPRQNLWAHQCRDNVLKPVRYAVEEAARTLKTSESHILALVSST